MSKVQVVTLNSFLDITMGQSPEAEFVNQEGLGMPLLNGPAEFTDRFPIPVQYTTSAKRVAGTREILFCVRGSTTGRMNIADQKYAIGRGLAAISHKKGIHLNSFVKGLIETNINNILGGTLGSVFPNITKEQLYDFKCSIPHLLTQQAIASILSVLDDKIELNNRINAELEEMAKTLYDYWFIQLDFPNENGKPYKSSGDNMLYNAELRKEIPKGWEVKSLFDIAVFTNGLACQKFRPINEEYLPVIKIREMNEGVSKNTERVRKDIPKKYIINDGDILFSWSASLDVKIWYGGIGGLNQHIFKVTSETYPKSFYYFELLNYLQHFKMMAELRKTTMGHITIDHLKYGKIAVPPKKLLIKIDKILNPLLEKIILNQKQNQTLTSLRDWLLPMLMNGQVTMKKSYQIIEEKLSLVAED